MINNNQITRKAYAKMYAARRLNIYTFVIEAS